MDGGSRFVQHVDQREQLHEHEASQHMEPLAHVVEGRMRPRGASASSILSRTCARSRTPCGRARRADRSSSVQPSLAQAEGHDPLAPGDDRMSVKAVLARHDSTELRSDPQTGLRKADRATRGPLLRRPPEQSTRVAVAQRAVRRHVARRPTVRKRRSNVDGWRPVTGHERNRAAL
jgi:hypothetical protein